MFFCDRPRPDAPGGNINREYFSLFSDDVPALAGRSPIACYTDFMVRTRMHAFACMFLSHPLSPSCCRDPGVLPAEEAAAVTLLDRIVPRGRDTHRSTCSDWLPSHTL